MSESRMSDSDFSDDQYKMNHRKRGVAMIINNTNFRPETGLTTRLGSNVDAESMSRLLNTLGFESIHCYDDLRASDIRDKIEEVARMDHTDNDCFLCVILTHGEEGYVFGTDNKVTVDELVLPFKGDKCPTLAGKPKLFFIQASRGEKMDQGTTVHDGPEMETEEEEVIRRIPTEADFLMAYSVVAEFVSWRNIPKGSWFIRAIVDVFSRNWETMDVLTMMTRVNKKVAFDFESNALSLMRRKKQIPCITSMLTKDLYFTKR